MINPYTISNSIFYTHIYKHIRIHINVCKLTIPGMFTIPGPSFLRSQHRWWFCAPRPQRECCNRCTWSCRCGGSKLPCWGSQGLWGLPETRDPGPRFFSRQFLWFFWVMISDEIVSDYSLVINQPLSLALPSWTGHVVNDNDIHTHTQLPSRVPIDAIQPLVSTIVLNIVFLKKWDKFWFSIPEKSGRQAMRLKNSFSAPRGSVIRST